MAGVRISNLAHEFDGREVFRSIDLAYDGSCLAVTGPNGSGKSTLLRILAGLLTPTSGEARFVVDGQDAPRERLRGMIGLAAPDVRLYAELSARENLRFLLRARGCGEIDERASSALERVGLCDRGDDRVGELSSGLRQRAALAAAIAHDPVILLLDEPFTGLDFPTVVGLVDILQALRKERISVFYTTHDRFFVENWAESVMVLRSGRVVFDGRPDEAMNREDLRQEIGNWEQLKRRIE